MDYAIRVMIERTMYERAGAHITRVKAGHLTPITRPRAVVRVILSAVEATR